MAYNFQKICSIAFVGCFINTVSPMEILDLFTIVSSLEGGFGFSAKIGIKSPAGINGFTSWNAAIREGS